MADDAPTRNRAAPRKTVDTSKLVLGPALNRWGDTIGIAVRTPRGRLVGEVIFEAQGDTFTVSYLKVQPAFQGAGVGRFLLRRAKEAMPPETTMALFMGITSRGVARLVEAEFGPLKGYDHYSEDQGNAPAFGWHLIEEDSPQHRLRWTRGTTGACAVSPAPDARPPGSAPAGP